MTDKKYPLPDSKVNNSNPSHGQSTNRPVVPTGDSIGRREERATPFVNVDNNTPRPIPTPPKPENTK